MRLLLFLLPLTLAAQTPREFRDFLVQHEGISHVRYRDSRGIPHIGIGHRIYPHENLGPRISRAQIDALFSRDLNAARHAALTHISSFATHPKEIRLLIVGLAFNVGPTGLSRFTQFIAALNHHDYLKAAQELENSRWARQVPGRARDYLAILEAAHVKRVKTLPDVARKGTGR